MSATVGCTFPKLQIQTTQAQQSDDQCLCFQMHFFLSENYIHAKSGNQHTMLLFFPTARLSMHARSFWHLWCPKVHMTFCHSKKQQNQPPYHLLCAKSSLHCKCFVDDNYALQNDLKIKVIWKRGSRRDVWSNPLLSEQCVIVTAVNDCSVVSVFCYVMQQRWKGLFCSFALMLLCR